MDEVLGEETSQKIQTPISEIKPIEKSRSGMITSREEIKEYVETPLINVCEHFWDLNVRTLASSANSKDIDHRAYIIVDYNSLSDENKVIAKKEGEILEDYDGRPAIDIRIPVTEQTTAEEITEKMIKVANRFQKQKATWIPSYTLQDMREIYAINAENEEYGVESFTGEGGYYYDTGSEKFYLSEEHFKKVTE